MHNILFTVFFAYYILSIVCYVFLSKQSILSKLFHMYQKGFSWENSKLRWGKFKTHKFQRVPKSKENHLMRTQKHKMLSTDVLNMAKHTHISLILIDFVQIIIIFNLFQTIFRGSFRFKKVPS